MYGSEGGTRLEGGAVESWRRWWVLALGSLALSGMIAGFVAAARVPPLHGFFSDGSFFRRLLVVHVDLALIVWLSASLVALLGRLAPPSSRGALRLSECGWFLALGGVLSMLLGAARGGVPVMANYVPVVDEPFFLVGLVSVGVGLAFGLLASLFAPPAPDADRSAWTFARAGAVTMLAALAAFGIAWRMVPEGLGVRARFEQIVWGGGHLMQGGHLALLLAVWAHLASRLRGPSRHPAMLARWGSGWLVMSSLGSLWLYVRGTASPWAVDGFTDWMRWALGPLVVAAVPWARATARGMGDGVSGFSPVLRGVVRGGVGMLALGMGLGLVISGPTTMIPAHYHASIGAVTLAAMGWGLWIFARGGVGRGDVVRWQPRLFAVGQAVFALGFALCGADGMPRKTFGSEQIVLTEAQRAGLLTMGLGGLLALAGGLWFLALGGLWLLRGGGVRPRRRATRLAKAESAVGAGETGVATAGT